MWINKRITFVNFCDHLTFQLFQSTDSANLKFKKSKVYLNLCTTTCTTTNARRFLIHGLPLKFGSKDSRRQECYTALLQEIKWSLTINPYKIRLSGDRRKIGKGEGHHLTSGGISSTVVELTGRTHTCSLGLSRGRSRQYTFNSKHHD